VSLDTLNKTFFVLIMWYRASLKHDRTSIQGLSQPDGNHKHAGVGRLVTLNKSRPLSEIITTLATYLGDPPSMMVATPQTSDEPASRPITTIAICAGSGGAVFGKLKQSVDLLITGELVHHEVLAVIEQGGSAICLNHSNSERAYLGAVMKGLLQAEIEKVWKEAREANEDNTGRGWEADSVSVEVSQADRDPFGYVVKSA
jgi:putative NIF3 family GTP cyclohydrolase 1 type 2